MMRLRRFPAEWLYAIVFAVMALAAFVNSGRGAAPLDYQVYYQLASAFVSGWLLAMVLSIGDRMLKELPRHRLWRGLALGGVVLSSVVLFASFPEVSGYPITRLMESSFLCAAIACTVLVVFLPISGLLSVRQTGRIIGEAALTWGPLFSYIFFAGLSLGAVIEATPLVWDPVLLRMDASLGFWPSEAVFHWEIDRLWVADLSNWGYPLLGFLIAGVAARIYADGATAQARRCVFALLLVGTLGIGCYAFMPAIGPINAFPELFQVTDPKAAEVVRAAALSGPGQIPGDPGITRNVMPSLHTAFTLVALAAAWGWRRRFFWLCLPVGLLQIATAMTLCVHYLVDLFAAVPFAALCWWLADRGVRRTGNAAAPLPELALHGKVLNKATMQFFASLVLALALFLWWAWAAPIAPALAWAFSLAMMGLPAWTLWRLQRTSVKPTEATAQLTDARVRLLTVAVFCSGGVALVLEQIYEKYLATLLGSSRVAAMLVLAVYLAGLALGAWLCPKRPQGAPRRLAALELFIAGWAALVGAAFFASDRWLGGWLAASGGSALTLNLTRLLIAAFWILPPTLAMGAQLPTLAAVLGGHARWRDCSIARFYGVNLAGAFAFTLGTPVLLFNTVGADGALWTVAALGAVVGAALWFGLPPADAAAANAAWQLSDKQNPGEAARKSDLVLAGAAGLLFFALEVVWFHLISAVCGASVYSFSMLLAVVLLGLAIAGWWAPRLRETNRTALARALGWSLLAMTVSLALWPWLGHWLVVAQERLRFQSFWGGELLKLMVVTLAVLPSAVALGLVFPLLLRRAEAESPTGRSAQVGRLCAVNVAGCIAGALLTGFTLIPLLGAETALCWLAVAVGLGWLALGRADLRRVTMTVPGVAGLLVLALAPAWDRLELTRGYGVYLNDPLSESARLAFFREDFTSGFVTVVETPRAGGGIVRTLLQNGKFDANDAGEMPAQLGFGLVAALHAPERGPALVIGCGSGQTAGLVARLGFDVTLAELSPAHLEAAAAQFGHINGDVLARPNVTVVVEDGRNFLLRAEERFDLIQIELTSVWFAGATNLYSREFYRLARERLTPGGVLVQWVQLHHISPRELASIIATARAEFPEVSLWRAGDQACLLASDRPPQLNEAVWRDWLTNPVFMPERLLTGITSKAAFEAQLLSDNDALHDLLANIPVALNTDANRWLEFQSAQYYLSPQDHRVENLLWLMQPK